MGKHNKKMVLASFHMANTWADSASSFDFRVTDYCIEDLAFSRMAPNWPGQQTSSLWLVPRWPEAACFSMLLVLVTHNDGATIPTQEMQKITMPQEKFP